MYSDGQFGADGTYRFFEVKAVPVSLEHLQYPLLLLHTICCPVYPREHSRIRQYRERKLPTIYVFTLPHILWACTPP